MNDINDFTINLPECFVNWTWKRLLEKTELRVSPAILPEYLCWIIEQLELWKN